MNRLMVVLAFVVAASGCGGGEAAVRSQPATSTVPSPVGTPLTIATSTSTTSTSTTTTRPPATTTTQPADYAMGSTLISQPRGHKITVYSYKSPVASDNRFYEPKAGDVFAAIDVEQCAGPGGDMFGPNRFDWELAMPDNTRIRAGLTVTEPQLASSPLGPNDCIRGWVSFEVPASVTPRYVVYNAVTSGTAKWRVV